MCMLCYIDADRRPPTEGENSSAIFNFYVETPASRRISDTCVCVCVYIYIAFVIKVILRVKRRAITDVFLCIYVNVFREMVTVRVCDISPSMSVETEIRATF